MFHGERDPVVPIHHGRRLFDAALGPKEFVPVAGAGHTEAFGDRRPDHKARIVAFLVEAAR